jgi:hypothetical protein
MVSDLNIVVKDKQVERFKGTAIFYPPNVAVSLSLDLQANKKPPDANRGAFDFIILSTGR